MVGEVGIGLIAQWSIKSWSIRLKENLKLSNKEPLGRPIFFMYA